MLPQQLLGGHGRAAVKAGRGRYPKSAAPMLTLLPTSTRDFQSLLMALACSHQQGQKQHALLIAELKLKQLTEAHERT